MKNFPQILADFFADGADMMIFAIIIFMRYYKFLFLLFFALSAPAFASSTSKPVVADFYILEDTIVTEATDTELLRDRPHPFLKKLRDPEKKNKKLACAIMAFPFPFGIVGLHRIYMGTAPHVPIVYIASLGGVFGILPLIDFIVILFKKNPEVYYGSRKVFMWIN